MCRHLSYHAISFHRYREEQLFASEGLNASLGVEDIIAPVICLLDHMYAAEESKLLGKLLLTSMEIIFVDLIFSFPVSGCKLDDGYKRGLETPGVMEMLRAVLG